MAQKPVTILAIETSCDETGVAIVQKDGNEISVLADQISSQADIHALTGGVVPDIAAREHVRVISPLIQSVLIKSGLKSQVLIPRSSASRRSEVGSVVGKSNVPSIDGIGVTIGPGLMPALSIGVQTARTLAYVWQKPLVPVHHIEGHIYSALLVPDEASKSYKLTANSFPALALIISGGHTLLILIRDHLQYEIIGSTRDDAAGEAFDKVARLLELPYPGGPNLSKLAETGDSTAFQFPRPMLDSKDFDVSFSGLKTAVLYTLRDQPDANRANIAASFEQAVVDTLVGKTKRALRHYKPKTLLLAGGVAANTRLRTHLSIMADEENIELRIAPLQLCGDNAIMIGQVGVLAFEFGRTTTWQEIDAQARVSIETFSQKAKPTATSKS